METVTWWPVLLAAVANMALGFLWYGPLFGKQWMKEAGISKADIDGMSKEEMMKTNLIALAGSVVMAYVLAQLILLLDVGTAAEAAELGFWSWLGFMAPLLMADVLWMGKSWTLWLINGSYRLAAMIAMGLILVEWL